MKLTKKSILTGIEHTLDLPITEEDYYKGVIDHNNGTYIQSAFPTLNADQREFVLSGITIDEWDIAFGDDE